MAEKNRASVLAIVEETVPGTLELPTAGTQYLALQEGFSFNPNFETLENAEIRASIGASKLIQGLESPEGSFDHYLRHSGVEGQAPNFGPVLKSLLGARSVNATERLTAASSTVSVVKLASGGTDFARGKAVLVKDGTNKYSIRPVLSVATNDLTLGFNLPAAPAAGIGVGKCVNYSPANEGHPTLSLHLYRGNGGAYEAMAGARVSQASFTIEAGQFINASYNFSATKYFFNPVKIGATNKYIDLTNDDGTVAAAVPEGIYTDPHDLAAAIQAAINAASPGETATVVYLDASGKFKISSTGTLLSLLFSSGTNAANAIALTLGFTATDKTGTAAATGYSSEGTISLVAPQTPSYDNADPRVAKNNEVLVGDATNLACFCASSIDIQVTNEIQDVECICAESGVQEKIINRRSIEMNVVGILDRFDADKFKKFRNNEDVRFLFNFGQKTGGNWVAGTCCSIFVPTATISSHELGDNNGLVTMELGIRPYVDNNGGGEFFINFL